MSIRRACVLILSIVVGGCVEDVASEEQEAVASAELGLATTHIVDTFSRGANMGGWVIGGSVGDAIQTTGGSPGAYLRDENQDAPAPAVFTTGASVFTGDYVAAGVSSLSVSLVIHQWASPPAASSRVHLVLTNDRGTSSALDDIAVWVDTGVAIPQAGGGWRSYEALVPSNSIALPARWTAYDSGTIVTGARADAVWSQVIRSVTRVSWSHGAPLSTNAFSHIDSGVDNAAIRRSAASSQ